MMVHHIKRMTDPIVFRETTSEASPTAGQLHAVAVRFDPSRRVLLRFEIALADDTSLDALRYARRAMIREERTRGLEWDEPSMEDPSIAGARNPVVRAGVSRGLVPGEGDRARGAREPRSRRDVGIPLTPGSRYRR